MFRNSYYLHGAVADTSSQTHSKELSVVIPNLVASSQVKQTPVEDKQAITHTNTQSYFECVY